MANTNRQIYFKLTTNSLIQYIKLLILLMFSSMGNLLYAKEIESVNSAVPLDPVTTVLDAFKTYDVVTMGEGNHNNIQGHNYRLQLIRDPRFAESVNDIVVEFGNSLYQDVIDRYISGENVPYNELRKVWLNTTQFNLVWDVPIYEEFYKAVRDINKNLPIEKKIRVLLGDSPVNWSKIHSKEDFMASRKTIDRDSSATDIIKREVLDKDRKALVIYGAMHLQRKYMYWNFKNNDYSEKHSKKLFRSIVTLLENENIKLFSIMTNVNADLTLLQKSVSEWKTPSITLLEGTLLGTASYKFYYPYSRSFINEKGTYENVSANAEKSPKMQEQFDAILYIGQKSHITYSNFSNELCKDSDYLKIRLERLAYVGWEDQLNEQCIQN